MGASIVGVSRVPVTSVADAAALAAKTGMLEGDLCYQEDTKVWYSYDGAAWNMVASQTATGGASMALISTKDLASDASWTSLSGYNYYLLVFDTTFANNEVSIKMTLNGDTGNNYTRRNIQNNTFNTGAGQANFMMFGGGNPVTHSGSGKLLIPVNRRNGQINVSGMAVGSDTSQYCAFYGGLYSAAAEVTRIDLIISGTAVTARSGSASLYGIKTA